MAADELIPLVEPLCPDIEPEIVRDFVSRMDGDYLAENPPPAIARHIQLAARLDLDHPVHLACEPLTDGTFELTIVAYDYFSEFAVICGLLSAYGLDIREGRIYTSADSTAAPPPRSPSGPFRKRSSQRPGLSRKKIVDVFHVAPMPTVSFGAHEQGRLAQHLDEMIRLLDAQRTEEARHRVNRRLVETLDRVRSRFSGLLHPIRIEFDNQSPTETVMDIRSVDTPAFLYAFANALAIRGIYVRKARVHQHGAELHDRFFVRSRHGGTIDDPAEQQELKMTATLIKQFTHFLTWAPDPAKALDHFDRFLDQLLEGRRSGRALDFLKEKKTLTTLAKLLGTSDFLWEDFLRRQHTNLLPMLESYDQMPLIRPKAELTRELRKRLSSARSDDQRRRALNQYKDQEMFRIDMKHLLEASTLVDFSQALTDLAEVVLAETIRECQIKLSHAHGLPQLPDGTACPLTVFGMGKFGGRELGYASDIELLFVYGGAGETNGRQAIDNSEYFERLVHLMLQWIEAKQEGIFHLDVRLRPHGGKGPLANSLDEIRRYYRPGGLAAPFERQALIKLRHVVGDPDLGRQVERHRDEFVYSAEPWNLAEALELRRRQVKELVEPGQVNIKYSPGGLLDVEYGVQYLQLLHGHRHPVLRTPNTLEAITALSAARILSREEAVGLRQAYLFFRTLVDGLRIVRGHAKDLVLPERESEAFVFLARRVGYTTEHWEEGAAKLDADLRRHLSATSAFFTARFAASR